MRIGEREGGLRELGVRCSLLYRLNKKLEEMYFELKIVACPTVDGNKGFIQSKMMLITLLFNSHIGLALVG